MRKYILIAAIIIIIALTSALGIKKIFFSGVNRWSDKAIVEAIVRSKPYLVVNDKPAIAISSVSMPEEGWYIATIRSIHDKEGIVPVKVLLTDKGQPGIAGGELLILLGPDIFTDTFQTSNSTVPSSVIVELKK